jgi:hypothetical protein
MSILWNGQKVRSVKGEDDLIHTLTIPLTAIRGTNVLEIAGEGKSDSYGMTIANVSLVESQAGPNLVKNGDFAANFLKTYAWTTSKGLPGWEIPNQIEQGYGRVYNANWGNTVVIELDSSQNDILRQKVDLKSG